MNTFTPKREFLVAIDSDGCAFDTMELKHKECFIPNTIRYWGLQAVSRYARETAEFVNLYSRWRGINRFPALVKTFDLLRERPEVRKRPARLPDLEPLRAWVARSSRLSHAPLREEIARTGEEVLSRALAWSEAVNATVADMVHGVPPFAFVRESLGRISEWADVIVCSVTATDELRREWEEHDLARYVSWIAGQEAGVKKDILLSAAAGGSPRGPGGPPHVLMIGDAPGDLDAARAAGARFFPIEAEAEEESWERFCRQGAERFRKGEYTDEYEAALISRFEARLPETPPWKI